MNSLFENKLFQKQDYKEMYTKTIQSIKKNFDNNLELQGHQVDINSDYSTDNFEDQVDI